MDLGGWRGWKDLGRFGEGQVVIRIYCMEKIIFSIKKKNNIRNTSIYMWRLPSSINFKMKE